MPEPVLRRADGRTYSVFVAGADDCDQLRDAAIEVFEDLDFPRGQKFRVFDWRRHKSPGHMRGEFQESIFEDAQKFWEKDECDIFVLIIWHKFGADTKREYDYYIDKQKSGEIQKLFVCFYNCPVHPRDLEHSKIDQLFEWVQEVQHDWAEIEIERGRADTPRKFYRAMTRCVNGFLDEASE